MLLLLKDCYEPDFDLGIVEIDTSLDYKYIDSIFKDALDIAKQEVGCWQTDDVVERLPKEWNARFISYYDVYL